MKFILCMLVLFTSPVCLADDVKLTASWHAVGKPIAELSSIDTPDFPVASELTVKGDTVEGRARVKLSDMDTANGTRNKHMLGYLDAERFPEAVLKIEPAKFGPDNFAWTGTLAVKGMAKPVHGTATVKGRDVWAQFTVNLRDYGIAPSFAGVGIEDDVTVTVKGTY